LRKKSRRLDVRRQELFDELSAMGVLGKDNCSKWNWLKFVQEKSVRLIEELVADVRYRLGNPKLPPLEDPGAYANRLLELWKIPM